MENKKFMLGDEPKSYPPSPPQVAYGNEEQRTTSPPPSTTRSATATTETTHTGNSSGKRPIRHLAKRRSGGARYMKRSTSMEDTSKTRIRRSPSQQRLQSFSPMPIMTQLPSDDTNSMKQHNDQQQPRPLSKRNDSNTSTTHSRTAPSSFIVSTMECAKPIEQTLHATAKSLSPCPPVNVPHSSITGNNEPPCSSATKALLYVSTSSSPSNTRQSNKSILSTTRQQIHHQHQQRVQRGEERDDQRKCLTSRFLQQQPTSNNNLNHDDRPYQKIMDDQYRDLQQYHHPMLTSLMRCLNNKQFPHPPSSSSSSSVPLKTPLSLSSAFLVPTTATSPESTTGTNHQRHRSHSDDYAITTGRQLQQQQPIHADQRHTIHKNHMKKVLLYNDMHHPIGRQSSSSATQQGSSMVSSSDFISPAKRSFALSMASSSASASSPWVTSIWGRVWNGLIKA